MKGLARALMLKVFQSCFFAEYFHVELVWLFVQVPICTNQFFADLFLCRHMQNLPGKLGQQSAICWNSLGLFRDYGLNYIF